jgi:ParB/RepB/Spo0J family partition protein
MDPQVEAGPLSVSATERPVPVESIGERFAPLRLHGREAVANMRRSLEQHGLLSPVAVFQSPDGTELIDGFKRLGAARAMGWKQVRARTLDVDAVGAKLAIGLLHQRVGLTEMEEAWLIRSLYRDDGLNQPAIGARLGRHKSWVSRRLLLAEALDEAVQTDVRLGLLAPRAAVELALLPRGNQRTAAQVVVRTGMTTRQTATLVGELLTCPSDAERARIIQDRLEHPGRRAAPRPARRARTAAEWILADVATMRRAAGRLQGRLLGQPLGAFGPRVAEVTAQALMDLLPVLGALGRTIETSAATGGAA